MDSFKTSYEEYYEEKHGKKWEGFILDKNYLLDLKESMEKLFDIEK